ncbi:DUF397 domain-containing protein [Actinomadura namibiensis]|uniref:DUF397 domain-containing protein n=1 Tax=Actinomadura namibiensis TaxID=182080 RepID=A0A7W3LT17_ACTNM|nr:DUF397 domain-containing protein [Actinomadura namibiensis]MBA8953702.1 hypothetical protein [Actinomadura namibiensis]
MEATENELMWRKSSRSGSNGGDCVEAASTPDAVAIRDSKSPGDGPLLINREEARALSERIKVL